MVSETTILRISILAGLALGWGVQPAVASDRLYGLSASGTLNEIDPATGALAPVGAGIPDWLMFGRGAALDPNADVFYVLDGGVLRGVSTRTGTVVSSAGLGTDGSNKFIEFDAEAGELYTITFSTGTLQEIDPATGALTAVGGGIANCCTVRFGASALDPNAGVLYFIGRDVEASTGLYGISTQTGTVVSSPTLSADDGIGAIEFDAKSDTLFAMTFDRSTATATLARLDPATGALTAVGGSIADCCAIWGGVSTLDPEAGVFYFVGQVRSDTAAPFRLYGVSTQTGALVSSAALPPDSGIGFIEFDTVPDAVASDFNTDLMSDILWRNSGTGTAMIWQMNGFTKEDTASIGAVGTNWQVADLGDFDGGGAADILWRDIGTGNVIAWQMNGFTREAWASIGSASADWRIAGLGDFDGDRMSDILWRNTSTGAAIVWRMTGLAMDSANAIGTVPTDWRVVGVGDFTGEGKADILWRNTGTGTALIWEMDGTTTVASASIGTVPLAWQVAGLGDFTGDRKSDILWRNAGTGAVVAWQMNGFTKEDSASIGAAGPDWQIVRLGDYDGGGQSDILWRNTTTGDTVIWQMNGLARDLTGSIGVVDPAWLVQ